MNARRRPGSLSRTAFAAVLRLAAACGGPVRERLAVDLPFAGQTCAAAGVARVQVAIAGEILNPDTFQCIQAAGRPLVGVDLGRFLGGTYSLQVDAFDAARAPHYHAV